MDEEGSGCKFERKWNICRTSNISPKIFISFQGNIVNLHWKKTSKDHISHVTEVYNTSYKAYIIKIIFPLVYCSEKDTSLLQLSCQNIKPHSNHEKTSELQNN